MNANLRHESVLLEEAVAALNLEPESIVIDATFGRGGHSTKVLEQLGENGRLIAIDKDPAAIEFANQNFGNDKRFTIEHCTFAEIAQVANKYDVNGKVSAILMDLGVSSPQLDEAERGFSFSKDGPLDMRMDSSRGTSAAQWIAKAKESEIKSVLRDFGEEKQAGRIARKIVSVREEQPITRTLQLAKIIEEVIPKRHDMKKHPATRSFQAIRIFINNELGDLAAGLEDAFSILKVGGRLVIISFHSLEDRIVKRFFKRLSKGDDFPKDLPVRADELKPKLSLVGKPFKPTELEVDDNVRSRSAIMRVAEKL
ncbi:MAG: 16S rRNA (cytosine(1402)-N(4))-methyltransferase RsmH [Gammaproteobacteria bacterium]|nr:16S rRNA (cytosine(1402)-N(4))-methyltransferase RsmH [Gammaproteobacteria bacterium]